MWTGWAQGSDYYQTGPFCSCPEVPSQASIPSGTEEVGIRKSSSLQRPWCVSTGRVPRQQAAPVTPTPQLCKERYRMPPCRNHLWSFPAGGENRLSSTSTASWSLCDPLGKAEHFADGDYRLSHNLGGRRCLFEETGEVRWWERDQAMVSQNTRLCYQCGWNLARIQDVSEVLLFSAPCSRGFQAPQLERLLGYICTSAERLRRQPSARSSLPHQVTCHRPYGWFSRKLSWAPGGCEVGRGLCINVALRSFRASATPRI